MGNFIDLTGKRFGMLVVESRAENYERFSKTHNRTLKYARWNCICDCGIESSDVLATDLKSGSQISCGCVRSFKASERVKTHGKSETKEYNSWLAMKSRCTNPKDSSFYEYGEVGITVYEDWLNDFVSFFEYIGPKPSARHSIDRIDSTGNYEPGNVKWSLPAEQSQNTRKPKNGKNRYKWVKSASKNRWQGQFVVNGIRHKTKLYVTEKEAAIGVYLLYKDVMGFYPRYWDDSDITDLGLPHNE